MREAASVENETPFDRLLLVLCGPAKGGKSRTAATARKPVLFFDFDKRRQSLAGIKDVYALTYFDEQWPMMPTGYSDFLSDISKVEKGEAGGKIKDLIPGTTDERIPRTIVLDSIASFATSVDMFNKYSNKDLRRTLNVGGRQIFMGAGWDTWNAEMAGVKETVMRLLALPTKPDIILIFHEDDEQAPSSTAEKKVFTGKKSLWPARYSDLGIYFSELWRVTRETGGVVPKIQVVPDYKFTASSNLDFSKIKPEQLNPPTGPNISELIKLATGKV